MKNSKNLPVSDKNVKNDEKSPEKLNSAKEATEKLFKSLSSHISAFQTGTKLFKAEEVRGEVAKRLTKQIEDGIAKIQKLQKMESGELVKAAPAGQFSDLSGTGTRAEVSGMPQSVFSILTGMQSNADAQAQTQAQTMAQPTTQQMAAPAPAQPLQQAEKEIEESSSSSSSSSSEGSESSSSELSKSVARDRIVAMRGGKAGGPIKESSTGKASRQNASLLAIDKEAPTFSSQERGDTIDSAGDGRVFSASETPAGLSRQYVVQGGISKQRTATTGLPKTQGGSGVQKKGSYTLDKAPGQSRGNESVTLTYHPVEHSNPVLRIMGVKPSPQVLGSFKSKAHAQEALNTHADKVGAQFIKKDTFDDATKAHKDERGEGAVLPLDKEPQEESSESSIQAESLEKIGEMDKTRQVVPGQKVTALLGSQAGNDMDQMVPKGSLSPWVKPGDPTAADLPTQVHPIVKEIHASLQQHEAAAAFKHGKEQLGGGTFQAPPSVQAAINPTVTVPVTKGTDIGPKTEQRTQLNTGMQRQTMSVPRPVETPKITAQPPIHPSRMDGIGGTEAPSGQALPQGPNKLLAGELGKALPKMDVKAAAADASFKAHKEAQAPKMSVLTPKSGGLNPKASFGASNVQKPKGLAQVSPGKSQGQLEGWQTSEKDLEKEFKKMDSDLGCLTEGKKLKKPCGTKK